MADCCMSAMPRPRKCSSACPRARVPRSSRFCGAVWVKAGGLCFTIIINNNFNDNNFNNNEKKKKFIDQPATRKTLHLQKLPGGMVRFGVAQHGVVWCGVAWYGIILYDTRWMTLHDMKWHNFLLWKKIIHTQLQMYYVVSTPPVSLPRRGYDITQWCHIKPAPAPNVSMLHIAIGPNTFTPFSQNLTQLVNTISPACLTVARWEKLAV